MGTPDTMGGQDDVEDITGLAKRRVYFKKTLPLTSSFPSDPSPTFLAQQAHFVVCSAIGTFGRTVARQEVLREFTHLKDIPDVVPEGSFNTDWKWQFLNELKRALNTLLPEQQ